MRCVVIGNGQMAIECLEHMRSQPGVELCLVVSDPKDDGALRRYCQESGVTLRETADLNASELVAELAALRPDHVFNINSRKLFKRELLATAQHGFINFHNSPLPRYRGLNVCSWAIIQGEQRYGVTWHLIDIDKGIDAGPVLAQREFELSPRETAASLILRCAAEGVALFADFFPRFVAGNVTPREQDHTQATLYYRKDTPNQGHLDLRWEGARIERHVRGLNFNPLPNDFVYPLLSLTPETTVVVGRVELLGPLQPSDVPGTLLGCDGDGLLVACADARLRLRRLGVPGARLLTAEEIKALVAAREALASRAS